MPRRLRIEMSGGVYHVTNRGVDRTDIVRDDKDREQWYRLFTRAAIRCHWRVFAEVLMTNHFHIFLKTPEPNLSAGLHAIESGYATYFNKRHHRHGALFQGRFNAVLVEHESHAWSLSRYVHLNPCRANLATQPAAFRWSSYHWYLDPRKAPEWLDWRTILAEFGGTEAAARIAYRRFVEQDLHGRLDDPIANAYAGVLLGSPAFVERYRHLVDDPMGDPCRPRRRVTLEDVTSAVATTFEVLPEVLSVSGRHGNAPRDAAIWLAREITTDALDAVAAAFGGVTRSAVTDAVRRCERRMSASNSYRDLCDAARRLAHPPAFQNVIDRFAAHFRDHVVAAEARGFIFAAPLALELNAAFIPVRKPGKLPFQTKAFSYDLEYGTDELHMHVDALSSRDRVLIVDDLLATGGTMLACINLVEHLQATITGCAFVVELSFLQGREKLAKYDVLSLVNYADET